MRTNRSLGQREQYAGRGELVGLIRRPQAATAVAAGAAGRVRTWLSARHSLRGEVAVVLALYGLYELARGLVVGDSGEGRGRSARASGSCGEALTASRCGGERAARCACAHRFHRHARSCLSDATPGRHRRRSALAPSAPPRRLPVRADDAPVRERSGPRRLPRLPDRPPRLAGIGIVDTVSSGRIDLNRGLVSSLYNPDAAVPSMHIGYAVVVGASLLRCTRSPTRKSDRARRRGVQHAPVAAPETRA